MAALSYAAKTSGSKVCAWTMCGQTLVLCQMQHQCLTGHKMAA